MIKIKLSAGSKYSKPQEARAIENLQRILSGEDGYLIPVLFIGKQVSNCEIDAVLLLPDAIFFLDFKDWHSQRIEVGGLNGKIRFLVQGAGKKKQIPSLTMNMPHGLWAASWTNRPAKANGYLFVHASTQH